MGWVHLVDDAAPLAATFGDLSIITPTVTLHELTVVREGPAVQLRIDVAEFPASPPAKWRNDNTVQVTLSLEGVTGLRLTGIGTSMAVTLDAERDLTTQAVTWTMRSATLNGSVTSRFSRIAKVSAYRNGE